MLSALGCLYGGLSMACTTGNFWTKAKLSRPSTTLPNCESKKMQSHSNELFKEHELLDDEVTLLQEGEDPRDMEAEYSVEAGQEGVADVNGGGRVNDHTIQYDSSASQVV
uniref:Uncharacterized protein n=1 Tax=Caenorhabditis japonica TaxID=281687 RepID=A0A8R1IC94_CAEJA